MAETRGLEKNRDEELVLVDRLVRRQGVSHEEALRLVADHRKGRRAEIDPALMEGLETI
jgi:hypothetical protein